MNRRESGPSSMGMIVHLLGLALGVSFPISCAPVASVRADDIVLEFAYGSEKEKWITDVTRAYNAAGHVVKGKRVRVNATPMGSGEAVEEVLAGTRKAHLLSPASGAFIELGNAESRAGAGGKDLVKETKNLVLSPVVIAI
jgi:Ca-activated chloride channel homolog